MKKYLIVGDYIHSKNDGDKHYVNADRLIKLYNLRREKCILMEREDPHLNAYIHRKDLRFLTVRYNGNYQIKYFE